MISGRVSLCLMHQFSSDHCRTTMDTFHLISLAITTFLYTGEAKAGEGLTAYSFLLGQGSDGEIHQLSFKPDDGQKFREKFEAKHGPRGRFLIEKFGQGYSETGPAVLDHDISITKLPKKSKNRKSKPITTTEPSSEWETSTYPDSTTEVNEEEEYDS